MTKSRKLIVSGRVVVNGIILKCMGRVIDCLVAASRGLHDFAVALGVTYIERRRKSLQRRA